jgi:hypothetical protein
VEKASMETYLLKISFNNLESCQETNIWVIGLDMRQLAAYYWRTKHLGTYKEVL